MQIDHFKTDFAPALFVARCIASCAALLLCGGGCSSKMGDEPGEPANVGSGINDPQIPPQNTVDLETWLGQGQFQNWAHEPSVHEARSPSPHEPNQIFENDALAGAADPADLPVGAAAVKVLYAADMRTVVGHSIQVKVAPAPGRGSSWYWYQKGGSLSADGINSSLCVGCHSGSNDLVFTVVTESISP